jgi:hypothetical protein
MKRSVGFFIMFLFCAAPVAAAPLDNCKNKFAPAFESIINASGLNFSSPSLASDVAALLQPKMDDLVHKDPDCISAKNDLLAYRGAELSIETSQKIFDIELQFEAELKENASDMEKAAEFESVMPWYGILVVKKGSADEYVNKELPVISTEFMKDNHDKFWPDNSAGGSAWNPLPTIQNMFGGDVRSGCTYGSHASNDNDVINRAAHVTFDETDKFWSGNDYYIYDGKDVYWGWASLAGEVALAVVTFGASTAITAGKAAANTARAAAAVAGANRTLKGMSTIRTVALVNDADKVNDAAKALKAVKAGDAAAKADAIKKANDAGIVFRSANPRVSTLNKAGNALGTATTYSRAGIGAGAAAAWTSGFFKPWKLVSRGATAISPRRIAASTPQINKLTGLKRNLAVGTIAAGEVGIGIALMKAYGYSTSSLDLMDNVKFSGFGLLSGDDIEGRENEVSHGAWVQIDELNEANEGDRLKEVLRFAEEFKSDIDSINKGGECDIDIYVVQVGISNPALLGKREAYYWLYTKPDRDGLRVNGK